MKMKDSICFYFSDNVFQKCPHENSCIVEKKKKKLDVLRERFMGKDKRGEAGWGGGLCLRAWSFFLQRSDPIFLLSIL